MRTSENATRRRLYWLYNWFRARGDRSRATIKDVKGCYRLLLGRRPDEHGFATFRGKVREGISVEELTRHFTSSREFSGRLASLADETSGRLELVDLSAGFSLYMRSDDWAAGKEMRLTRQYERHVADRVRSLLRVGHTFVDVGASIGFYTVMAGRLVGPGGRVVAFEPGTENLTLLQLNIDSNRLQNVEVHQVALSNEPGLLLYTRAASNGRVSLFDGKTDDLRFNRLVTADTLDSVLGQEPRVDLLKVDVEGAEGLVLRGASSLLRRCRPSVIFEFSPPSLEVTSGESGRELLGYLECLGYSFEIVSSTPERRIISGGQLLDRFSTLGAEHLDVLATP